MDVYGYITEFYQSANTQKRVIGKSLFGRNLYAIKCGEGSPVGISVYSIHGRERVVSYLAPTHFKEGVTGSVWLIPLANPDGALLSERGLESVPERKKAWFLKKFGEENLNLWKANGRGVDLNVNFDADWGKGVKNCLVAGGENYIGKRPFSEPETKAIKLFTEEIAPDYTVSWHTKGEEIYWYYFQALRVCSKDKRLAEVLSETTGYPLKEAKGSVGGYKDWCIQKRQIPAFTIETGSDEYTHPLGEDALKEIEKKTRYALKELSAAVKRENGI